MNRKSSVEIDSYVIRVSPCFFASLSKRLASKRSRMAAQLIRACNRLSLAERSGLVFVAAYCKEPMLPLRSCFSFSVTVSFSCFLRCLSIWMGSILFTYSLWSKWMRPLSSWFTWIPVKTKLFCRFEPKGNFCSSCLRAFSNSWSPAHKPSSTWTPSTRCTFWSFPTKLNRQGSNGLILKPRASRLSFSSWYHKYGALTSPYADFRSSQTWSSVSPIFLRSSIGGSTPRTRSSRFDPRRNAVLISKDWICHCWHTQYWKIRDRDSFWSVGLSLEFPLN